jgi:hypothetical protein
MLFYTQYHLLNYIILYVIIVCILFFFDIFWCKVVNILEKYGDFGAIIEYILFGTSSCTVSYNLREVIL